MDKSVAASLQPFGFPEANGVADEPLLSSGVTGLGAFNADPSLLDEVDDVVEDARRSLIAQQRDDGHFVFEIEADTTIPAEYVLLRHFVGEPAAETEPRIADYLRSRQADHGGWPLFHDGDFDISASVKAYFALKVIGDDINAPHMVRAREAILAAGGAARSNVFTRIMLALYGEVPWRAVPVMPVEIMLLPRWFPFHLSKVSYWSRTVIAPLLVLMSRKPRAENPRDIHISELFVTPPEEERRYNVNPTGSRIGNGFLVLDRLLRSLEPLIPASVRNRAERAALAFIEPRLNGEDGLGAIYPAMANVVMMYHALGYSADDPKVAAARQAVEHLRFWQDKELDYCQPCASPIWDTSLAAHALLEAGDSRHPSSTAAASWLAAKQIRDVRGDWADSRPDLEPAGWAFQYNNDYYPDVDDTAVVAMALHRADPDRYEEPVAQARDWIIGMQSRNGGWGAFDVDNTAYYLNHIPFADHGALLDPPTVDVTARCIGFLAQTEMKSDHPVMARALAYLRREQEEDGSWFGRWGTNYVYGTWSALHAFNAAGEDPNAPHIRRAVDWLISRQQPDGGWGEDGATYWGHRRDEVKASTPSQTAWAVLALMAVGEVESESVARGIAYLARAPRNDARWHENLYTGVGFPRVFYLRYHGYAAYFPLWALARYRNLMRSNDRQVAYGL